MQKDLRDCLKKAGKKQLLNFTQMSLQHFRELRKIYRTEGLTPAAKFDFDNSVFRLILPYKNEFIPPLLGLKNYAFLSGSAKPATSPVEKILINALCLAVASGSECARYIATAATYTETQSWKSALLAWTVSSGFFSARNHLSNRFYKPR